MGLGQKEGRKGKDRVSTHINKNSRKHREKEDMHHEGCAIEEQHSGQSANYSTDEKNVIWSAYQNHRHDTNAL